MRRLRGQLRVSTRFKPGRGLHSSASRNLARAIRREVRSWGTCAAQSPTQPACSTRSQNRLADSAACGAKFSVSGQFCGVYTILWANASAIPPIMKAYGVWQAARGRKSDVSLRAPCFRAEVAVAPSRAWRAR